jgi:hypothetical protein
MDGGTAPAYRTDMDSAILRRRAVALLAAYAMVLQTLLLGMVAATPPNLSFGVLCSHDTGGTGLPIEHDQPCAAVCAALGHGIAGPVPPDVVVGIARPQVIASPELRGDWTLPPLAMRRPQAPRGPPLA